LPYRPPLNRPPPVRFLLAPVSHDDGCSLMTLAPDALDSPWRPFRSDIPFCPPSRGEREPPPTSFMWRPMQAPSGPATCVFSLRHITGYNTSDKQNAAVHRLRAVCRRCGFLRSDQAPFRCLQTRGHGGGDRYSVFAQTRKRANGKIPNQADPAWLETDPMTIEDVKIPIGVATVTRSAGDGNMAGPSAASSDFLVQ
jgi:hypothetical protein